MQIAKAVTDYLTGRADLAHINDETLTALRAEVPTVSIAADAAIIDVLVQTGLAESNSDARRILAGNAVAVNGQKIQREHFEPTDFIEGRLLLRRGKAFKDSALIELNDNR